MLLRFSGFFTLIFFLIFSANIFANPAGKSDENKEFDVNEMIMHHIKDAHEFHIISQKKHYSKAIHSTAH